MSYFLDLNAARLGSTRNIGNVVDEGLLTPERYVTVNKRVRSNCAQPRAGVRFSGVRGLNRIVRDLHLCPPRHEVVKTARNTPGPMCNSSSPGKCRGRRNESGFCGESAQGSFMYGV